MVNRLTIAILTSTIVMVTVLYLCDIAQLIWTPLSPFGMTHWIPELFAIFLIGRRLISTLNKTLVLTIGFCLALYSMLTYTLLNQTTLGIGTASIFVATWLIGCLYGTKKGRWSK